MADALRAELVDIIQQRELSFVLAGLKPFLSNACQLRGDFGLVETLVLQALKISTR